MSPYFPKLPPRAIPLQSTEAVQPAVHPATSEVHEDRRLEFVPGIVENHPVVEMGHRDERDVLSRYLGHPVRVQGPRRKTPPVREKEENQC